MHKLTIQGYTVFTYVPVVNVLDRDEGGLVVSRQDVNGSGAPAIVVHAHSVDRRGTCTRMCNYGHALHAALDHEPLWWVGRVPMGQKSFLTNQPQLSRL